jgi:hypothetical protein
VPGSTGEVEINGVGWATLGGAVVPPVGLQAARLKATTRMPGQTAKGRRDSRCMPSSLALVSADGDRRVCPVIARGRFVDVYDRRVRGW